MFKVWFERSGVGLLQKLLIFMLGYRGKLQNNLLKSFLHKKLGVDL